MNLEVFAIGGWMFGTDLWDPLRSRLAAPAVLRTFDGTEEGMEECLAAMRAAKRPRVLLGWSCGAMRILEAAAFGRLPAGIQALFLLSASARFTEDVGYAGARPAALRAMRGRLLRGDVRGCLADFFTACLAPDPASREWVEGLVAPALRRPPAQAIAGLDYLARTDLRARAGGIERPVFLLQGEQDRVVVPSQSAWLRDHLPQARRVLTPGGHYPSQEQWGNLVRLLADLADAAEGQGGGNASE